MKFNAIHNFEGLSLGSLKSDWESKNLKILKIVGEEVGTADVTRIQCDTIEFARFLFAAAKSDTSLIPFESPEDFDLSVLETSIVVDDDEVYIQEDIKEFPNVDYDGDPMVLVEPIVSDCRTDSALEFVTSFIYVYHLEDILIVDSNYSLDHSDLDESSRRRQISDIYRNAKAAAGSCISDGPKYDARQAFGIACPSCRFYFWENSGDICTAQLSKFPGLLDIEPQLDEMAFLLDSAARSLAKTQPNFQFSINMLASLAELLDLEDSEALRALIEDRN